MKQLIYELHSPKGVVKNKNVSNSSRLVLLEAEKYGVKWRILPCTQIIELKYNGILKTYYHQVPSATTALAKYSCNNKRVTTNLLHAAGISVPKGFRLSHESTQEYVRSTFDHLSKPLVVKPSNGTWGEAIALNITTYAQYQRAVQAALDYSGQKNEVAVVEEMVPGREYRILATQEKVIGVLYRRPASVVGDGKRSIKALIKEKNKNPIRGPKNSTMSHFKIRMDEKMRLLLGESGSSFSTVPAKGERVFLRRVSNISQGGDAIDMTDSVHCSVKDIALKAMRSIPGLAFAGIDFLTTDITQEQTEKSYAIIEINDSPGFDIHDFPYRGKNRHAAREFLFLMFPELRGEN